MIRTILFFCLCIISFDAFCQQKEVLIHTLDDNTVQVKIPLQQDQEMTYSFENQIKGYFKDIYPTDYITSVGL
ncbi:MAG: hypothetical protein ACPG4Z_08130, partial [Chitinophagales bacterium]